MNGGSAAPPSPAAANTAPATRFPEVVASEENIATVVGKTAASPAPARTMPAKSAAFELQRDRRMIPAVAVAKLRDVKRRGDTLFHKKPAASLPARRAAQKQL